MSSDGTALVGRLREAVDAHDLDRLVACFAADYRNETPAHPARGFDGRDQVRTNWERLFTGIPDLSADVLRVAHDGGTTWSEWEMRGTLPDGRRHLMRGVVIFGVADQQASWARFYLEPVDQGDAGIDAAIETIVGIDAP